MDNHTIPLNDSSIEWRDVPGYEGVYQVSSTGLVKRIKASKGATTSHVLKPRALPKGYQFVTLCVNSHPKQFYIHRLVLSAFKGDCPPNMEVNHLNGNRSDNRLENLEYVTHFENVQHTVHVLKNHRKGEEAGGAILNPNQVREIRGLWKRGVKQRDIALRYGVDYRTVWNIIHSKTWRHID